MELAEIRLELDPAKAKEIVFNIRGLDVVFNVASNELLVDGVKAPVTLINGKLKLLIYADRTGLEIFVNDGLVFMPVNYNLAATNRSLSVSAKGGTAKINNLEVYELKPIF